MFRYYTLKSGIFLFGLDPVAFVSAHFGQGTGSIVLDGVGCTGTEDRLNDCAKASTVTCSNGHSEDAGVRCQVEGKFSRSYVLANTHQWVIYTNPLRLLEHWVM